MNLQTCPACGSLVIGQLAKCITCNAPLLAPLAWRPEPDPTTTALLDVAEKAKRYDQLMAIYVERQAALTAVNETLGFPTSQERRQSTRLAYDKADAALDDCLGSWAQEAAFR